MLLTLLDFSAAFDTIDYEILYNRLKSNYGVSNDALSWVQSYFGGRTQSVCINGSLSEPMALEYGMPQGSLFGPFSFPKYSAPIGRIAEKHGVSYHLYADDTQLYVMCDPDDVDAAKAQLESCITDLRDWVAKNKLKLNDTKTEFLLISSRYSHCKPDISSIQIGNSNIPAASSARNIGCVMDSHFTMADHITSVCKASYIQLRAIAQIRKYLTKEAAITLVHSFVTSRLDNLNALLTGLPDCLLRKLQCIQNHAAKLVTKHKKHDHVTPLLKELHWLPIQQRVEYKVLLLTHKCLNDKAPQYLSSLLTPYRPARTLRSANLHLLVEKQPRLKTYGERAFSVIAPRLWNQLPVHVRTIECTETFKAQIKTILFRRAFNE